MARQNQIIILNETDPRFAIPNVLVAAGAVSTIASSTPTKSADAATAATGAVVPMVDGDGAIGQNFTGIAKDDSTDTVAAAGVVTLWLPLPGYVYAAKAKTASTARNFFCSVISLRAWLSLNDIKLSRNAESCSSDNGFPFTKRTPKVSRVTIFFAGNAPRLSRRTVITLALCSPVRRLERKTHIVSFVVSLFSIFLCFFLWYYFFGYKITGHSFFNCNIICNFWFCSKLWF